MPSSLMARLNATQGSAPTPAAAGSGRRSNVVTPPPPPPPTSSSLGNSSRYRPSSSLAAAAAASAPAPVPLALAGHPQYSNSNSSVAAIPAKSSSHEPQFKKQPLNATVPPSSSTDETFITKSTTDEITHGNTIPLSSTCSLPAPKITLIQQLLQHQQESPPIPPPYYMCSESEAHDRQQHLELSPLECSSPSTIKSGVLISTTSSLSIIHDDERSSEKAARHRPPFNPQYVIKKYRRSAAGGGALSEASDNCPRTLDQLSKTVEYLLGNIFVRQMPPPTAAVVDDAGGDDTRNTDPNEISIWGEEDTPVKAKHDDHARNNIDPNEISICGEEDTPVKKQRPPSSLQKQQEHTIFSLSDTVAFIDDRLRAVQKDLVTLLGNQLEEPQLSSPDSGNSISVKRQGLKQQRIKQTVREMQAKMVRYNILASYLLSDVPPSKYQVQFGARALRTSLACYLNLSTSLHEEYHTSTTNSNSNTISQQQQSQYQKEHRTQDEIMAYMALLHSSAVLRSEETALPPSKAGEISSSFTEDAGSGWGALLSTFCRQNGVVEEYPRWKWALELACVAQEGDYQGYFALLEQGPARARISAAVDDGAVGADSARFLILARCCASHSLTLVRLAQLRRYNHAFGKGERVSARDLARLLRLGTTGDVGDDEIIMGGAERAIDLCRDAGLPIVEKEGQDGEKKFYVAMKSAPINITGEEAIGRICNPGRTNDSFVFGSKLFEDGGTGGDDVVESLANQLLRQCDIQEDVDDWEEREGDYGNDAMTENSVAGKNGTETDIADCGARNDEDSVLIPPRNVMRNLIE